MRFEFDRSERIEHARSSRDDFRFQEFCRKKEIAIDCASIAIAMKKLGESIRAQRSRKRRDELLPQQTNQKRAARIVA
jgi:hypothetical protein